MKDCTHPDVVFVVRYVLKHTVFVLGIVSCSALSPFAQGSVQRTVGITNANGSMITIQSGTGATSYTLTIPPVVNPSTTTYSLLTASGTGTLDWTPTTGVAAGYVLSLQPSGSTLVPMFVDPSSVGGGSYVYYDVNSAQSASAVRTKYLFNVSYLASAPDGNAAGAVITSTAGNINRNATGLTITANASGSGTATGLSVSGAGGTTNNSILAKGNVTIQSAGGVASKFSLENPAGSFASTFTAGSQTGAINYTLPTSAPAANSLLYSAGGVTSTLSWTNAGSNGQVLTLAGGVPTWQNSAAGGSFVNYGPTTAQNTLALTSPNYLFNVAYATSATTNNALGAMITSGSGTSGSTNATGLTIAATANGTGTAMGLNVSATGGSVNYAAVFTGSVGIGNTSPAASLDISKDIATREFNYVAPLGGTVNNVNFDGVGNGISMVRIQTATAPFSITGLAGGQNGKHLTIYNGSNQTMTIVNQSLLSTGANRLVTGTTANLALPSTGSANFIYSSQESRWICYAISGTSGWLYTGNSGLLDNNSNFHGTLDDVPIRFVSGATNAPSTKMLLDINGNLLFGKNSGSASFSSGAGRLAFGDSVTTARLNSVPSFGNRVFNMIDPNAVVRVWRFNTNAGGTDPAIELVGGTNDNQGNSANTWWDVHTTGIPGTINTGTFPTGEHLCFRRRTGSSDSEYVSIFSGGNVGIGGEGTGGVPLADVRLNVVTTDDIASAVVPVLALNHRVRGTTSGANGTGVGMLFRSETSSANDQSMASINSLWTNATDASRTSALTFSTVNSGGALSEAMRISGQKYVGIGQTNPTQLVEVGDGNLLLSNTSGTAGQLQFEGTGSGISTFKAGTQGTTSIYYTLPTSQPSANQVLTASSVTGTGPYNVALGWANASSSSSSSTLYVIKTSDENLSGTTAMQDDNELVVTVGTNQTWEITGMIMATANSTTPNLKMGFVIPAGASMRVWVSGSQENTTTSYENFTLNTSNSGKRMTIGSTTNATLISIHGWVTTSSTGGDIQFRWAQNSNNGNAVTVKADSYLSAKQLQ